MRHMVGTANCSNEYKTLPHPHLHLAVFIELIRVNEGEGHVDITD